MKLHLEYDCYSTEQITWAAIIGIPAIIVWVIGSPILAFILLYKNKSHLEEGIIKKYLLILYQGLKPKTFYWEFVNTIRKTLILLVNIFLSRVSTFYQIMSAIIILIIVIRLQKYLEPYKLEHNNKIEIHGIIAGTLTLYCGLIFTQEENNYPGFIMMALIILIAINIHFVLIWFYYVLISFKFKNQSILSVIKIYEIILCIKSETQRDDLFSEVNIKVNKIETNGKSDKLTKKNEKVKSIVKRRVRGTSKKFLRW